MGMFSLCRGAGRNASNAANNAANNAASVNNRDQDQQFIVYTE